MRRSALLTRGSRLPLSGLLIVLAMITTLANLAGAAALVLVGGVAGTALDFAVEGLLWTLTATALAVSYVTLREAKEGTPVQDLADVFS
jgi:hypothetical protein